jgi:NAD(P) transhydrogenase subunit beta
MSDINPLAGFDAFMHDAAAYLYLVAAVCFIMALRGLSSPESSRAGNMYGMVGMTIAVLTTLASPGVVSYGTILAGIVIGGGIGTFIALRIQMTALPQLVAAFHSLVGLAAVFVAAAAFYSPEEYGIGVPGDIKTASLIEMGIGVAVGAVTFTGSVVAFAKLQGLVSGAPLVFPGQHWLNAALGVSIIVFIVLLVMGEGNWAFWALVAVALLLGFLLIVPIGGADMPVVVSMLNSYSGWAAAGIGFTLGNSLLIVTGALVGASGAILSYIMCKGMNRSIINVIAGGFGTDVGAGGAGATQRVDRPVKSGSADDAAFILKNASSVIVVPGYGMAVAQAQHALREMADLLKKEGVKVSYAIHPVAGRMPGHMNVLLAEANVPYDEVFELEDINREFPQADVAFVIGANDVTNPAAKTDPQSPIYGMPILDVAAAKTVLFIKRSLGSGYAGVENELFFRNNTMMLFGDAKKMCEGIVKALG